MNIIIYFAIFVFVAIVFIVNYSNNLAAGAITLSLFVNFVALLVQINRVNRSVTGSPTDEVASEEKSLLDNMGISDLLGLKKDPPAAAKPELIDTGSAGRATDITPAVAAQPMQPMQMYDDKYDNYDSYKMGYFDHHDNVLNQRCAYGSHTAPTPIVPGHCAQHIDESFAADARIYTRGYRDIADYESSRDELRAANVYHSSGKPNAAYNPLYGDGGIDDMNATSTMQRDIRKRASMDGAISKTSDYYKFHFEEELEREEAKPWWGAREY